ncbi:hypothetical protein [Mycobacterium colombiense]|uniref:hypothetical protein n=1 Tax=Mycobacterium colombiense TaxID=339268 RepID=UPI001F196533|nr:hypothetical protein [Mycobacterium colombiense]
MPKNMRYLSPSAGDTGSDDLNGNARESLSKSVAEAIEFRGSSKWSTACGEDPDTPEIELVGVSVDGRHAVEQGK